VNYRDDISRCIDYIEEHIKENITADEIALKAGYSLYHFCRVFHISTGQPLMEYVRGRKLSLARMDLLKDTKILTIAMDYGFDTASGFSKAFRSEFGYSPTQYVARMKDYMIAEKLDEIGGYYMKPEIKNKKAFQVAGYGIKTNIASGFTKDIAAYWENYDGENLESKLYKQLNPPKHGEVCMCVPSNGEGDMIYLLGVIVEDYSKVTDDMITVEVPEAEYAVFTTPPVDTSIEKVYDGGDFSNTIKATWKYIFEDWFPNSGYQYDESKLDFEFYDERCHSRPDTVMEIYVPICKME
jgi:AraC family transcriptional regulator